MRKKYSTMLIANARRASCGTAKGTQWASRAVALGHRGCVEVLSDELAHDSASEGTERGRRDGTSPHGVALNEVGRTCSRIPFLLWVQHVTGAAARRGDRRVQVGIAFSAKRKSGKADTISDIMFARANLP